MLRAFICFTLACLLSTISVASPIHKKISRVIYITVDGVRWQDIFLDHNRLPMFWDKYAKSARLYGEPGSNTTMEVASTPVSLPSYESQMAGVVTSCIDNDCARITVPTFPEELVTKLRFNRKDVASISCWEVMDNAVESVAGIVFTNHGTRDMLDPDTNEADPVMVELNKNQKDDFQNNDERNDKNTFAQSMHYLEKYKPKFLWISLGDADDYAHANNVAAYNKTLTFYDHVMDQLITTLKKLNLDEETMIIVTTDHGRGNGDNWVEHGDEFPESKQTWAIVFNGELAPSSAIKNGDVYHYSTLSIRPTVEAVFGLR